MNKAELREYFRRRRAAGVGGMFPDPFGGVVGGPNFPAGLVAGKGDDDPAIQAAFDAEIGRRMAQNAPILTQNDHLVGRTVPVPVDSGVNVVAGTTVTINVNPIWPIKPRFITIGVPPANVRFIINDIKIQAASQLPTQGGALDAGSFVQQGGSPVAFDMDVVPMAGQFSWTVTNIGSADGRFFATVFGVIVKGG